MTTHPPTPAGADAAWTSFYRVGGAAALLAAGFSLLDVLIANLTGGALPEPGKGTVYDWFQLFQHHAFLGLYGLGLLNLIYTSLTIPLFLALFGAHRQVNPAGAGLALFIFGVGAAIYLAHNAALPMLHLSQQYATASEAEKALLAAAGQTLLARGEDFAPGAFLGFAFTETADLLMALVMLRGGVFSRRTGWLGLAGFACLLIFTLWATFIPRAFTAALILGMLGGLLSLAWFTLTARRLFQLSR